LLRQLQGGYSEENPLTIDNLKPLPDAKHVLNKPQEYHPVGEPVKKKMYRPVVPRYFASGYDIYTERRKQKNPIDLAVRSIDEIVEECQIKSLLPLEIVTIFLNKSGTNQILKQFLELWERGKIHDYNFKDHPFTLVDHRRLSELLMHFFP
jgi:hypothetical protein